MGNYKLTCDAQDDLIRIHQWGVLAHGEVKADEYYNALFDRFEEIAEQPNLYQAVDYICDGYRKSVCGVNAIYYRISGDIVEIMSIIGRQDVDKALKA